jgi:GT2 family glycosyltransferase
VTKFSIVVPAYNAESTLRETLDAVQAQTFQDWECVVVDDGSKDETLAVASGYAARDPRVRAVTQANRGTGGAYNTGVSAAGGEYVVVCSADDLLLPDHLAEVSRFIDANGCCDILSTNGYTLKPDGSRQLVYGSPDDVGASLGLLEVIRGCFYGVGAVYRRGVFDLVGGYREGVFGEDYDFWLRALSAGARHCFVPLLLSLHRVSATQKSAHSEASFRSDIRILRDLEASGGLSRRERKAVHDSVTGRLALIAELDEHPVRRSARVVATYLARPASLSRAVGRRLRRAVRPSSRPPPRPQARSSGIRAAHTPRS